MDVQDIKKRYAEAYIEDFGDYEIISVDKRDMDWLIEQAEKSGSVHSRWLLMDTIAKQQKEIDELKFYIKAIEMNNDVEMKKLLENLGDE